MRRVLNATSKGVAFLLPPLSSRRLHARHASRVGWPTDVGLEKATTAYVAFRLPRRATSRSQLQCVFKKPWPNRASIGPARPVGAAAGFLRAIRGSGDAWGVFSPRGRHVARGKRQEIFGFHVLREGGASALVTLVEHIAHEVGMYYVVNVLFGYPRFFVSQARVLVVLGVGPGTVCIVEVCVVYLDTLTPLFELGSDLCIEFKFNCCEHEMVWLLVLPVRPFGVEVTVVSLLFWVAPTEPVTC
ncbi:hypothetical protein Taro_050052 [Colocasia esculenta]|uniref:Uncharacterized protein n=1 Tax=Colocasia esculenta TaxID=4460 RepID=A0A843XCE4_COLES|nr:hypothetical protein [Colocasia esculenta]